MCIFFSDYNCKINYFGIHHSCGHGGNKKCPSQVVVDRKWINDWIFASETSSIPPLPRQFFQLEVYNSDGSRLTESQIHSQLLRIRSQSWKTDKEPVGILTSEHRHTWGQAYNRLLTGTSQRGAASTVTHSARLHAHVTVWNVAWKLWQDMLRFETLLCSFQLLSVYFAP